MSLFSEPELAGIPRVGHDPETLLAETVVYRKYYDRFSSWKWYILEYDRPDTFFGLIVTEQTATAGQFTVAELEGLRGEGGGPAVCRDESFRPCKVEELAAREPAVEELLKESEGGSDQSLVRLEGFKK